MLALSLRISRFFRRSRWHVFALVIGLVLGRASPALAVEVEEGARTKARSLAQEALGHMHAEEWQQAQTLLAEAYALMPAPTLALLEARAFERMGRLVEAQSWYQRASEAELGADVPEAFNAAREEAARELPLLDARIPRLTLLVQGPGATDPTLELYLGARLLTASERSKPVLVDPGEQRIRVLVAKQVLVSTSLAVVEGDQKTVYMGISAVLPPVQSKAPVVRNRGEDARRTAGWVAFGVGGAGLGFGAATGIMMLDAQGKLEDQCGIACPASASDDLARFRATRTLSSVGYGVGLVGVAVGVYLLLSADEKKVSVSADVGVWSNGHVLGVQGAF